MQVADAFKPAAALVSAILNKFISAYMKWGKTIIQAPIEGRNYSRTCFLPFIDLGWCVN